MKKAQKFLSYLTLSAVVFSLWVLSGCSSSSSEPAPTLNIVALMASTKYQESTSAGVTDDKALDSLVKYASLYPDLITLLGGTDKYTLFAPSNKAFKNLLATPGFPPNIEQINPAIIQGVLYYHIITGEQLTTAFTNAASFNSLYPGPGGEAIVINSDGTLKTGSSNQNIHITVANQKATNGVFHITESVLIPPSVGATLTPILGTVAGTVLLGADFTDMAQIIGVADANFTEDANAGAFKISTWLAMPISGTTVTANPNGVTFFAIPNLVFYGAALQAGGTTTEADIVASFTTSSDAARGFLLNLLSVANEYSTAGAHKFSDNASITVLGSKGPIGVTTGLAANPSAAPGPYGIVFQNTTPTQAYLAAELDASSNGQLQVIAGILH